MGLLTMWWWLTARLRTVVEYLRWRTRLVREDDPLPPPVGWGSKDLKRWEDDHE